MLAGPGRCFRSQHVRDQVARHDRRVGEMARGADGGLGVADGSVHERDPPDDPEREPGVVDGALGLGGETARLVERVSTRQPAVCKRRANRREVRPDLVQRLGDLLRLVVGRTARIGSARS